MTTTFFNQLTRPDYEAWQAAGAPDHFSAPEYPKFSMRIIYRDGYFIAERWQASYVSIQGRDFHGQTLRSAGVVNVTKRGELGAKRFNLNENVRWVMNEAHRAWIAAGKPAEFAYIQ
jgi:hypothetical protein